METTQNFFGFVPIMRLSDLREKLDCLFEPNMRTLGPYHHCDVELLNCFFLGGPLAPIANAT